ncbi:MAG: hypothetical protein JKX91_05830 [Rhizobiaceae bacterium]|nr:hypothetical protein [Rhizobiaceae bacterium]
MFVCVNKNLNFVGAVFFIALAVVLSTSGVSQAVSCNIGTDTRITDAVTGTSACQLGTTNNDKLNPLPLQVNDDLMFGYNDWNFSYRLNYDPISETGTNSLQLSLLADSGGDARISGTWSIVSTAFSMYQDIMLVFKDGMGVPDVYVGYLLSMTSGDYDSPFKNSNNANLKDISHVSIYTRGTQVGLPPEVPIPAALPLFGTGLAILGFLGWRKKRKAA